MNKLSIYFILFLSCITFSINAQLTVSEINYKSDLSRDADDWIELYNTSNTALNISNYTFSDSVGINSYTLPANTILQAGARLVIFRNLAKFNNQYPNVSNKIGPFAFKLNSSDSIIIKNAQGVAVIRMAYKDSYPWPKGADGEGRTLEQVNQTNIINLSNPSTWIDGCIGGSAGVAPSACNDAIIISEVNYNSNDTINIGEFIELYNNSNATLNLGGYILKDGIDSVSNQFIFPANTMLPNGNYIVISNDTAALRTYHNNIAADKLLGNFNFNLNNGGELVRLYKPNGQLTFSMHYNDSIPWTDSADGMGYTLEIKNYSGRTNDGKNYFAGCLGGSPGMAYTPNCKPLYPTAINDIQKSTSIYLSKTNDAWLIQNKMQENLNLELYSITGTRLLNYQFNSASHYLNFENYPKGMYVLKITNAHFTKTFITNNY